MIKIQKQEIASWLLLDYQAKLFNFKEKLNLFESKYQKSFSEFESNINKSVKENFEMWDDYIEWKSYYKMSIDFENKIKEVEHGHFEIA